MTTDKELFERANPVSKTAVTTLSQRAAAGYEKAAPNADYLKLSQCNLPFRMTQLQVTRI